ncbi:helix-turn-helix domain-containing protein [Aliarcobacter butzleri]|uniref:helix-turn-helix domain-containing protein n=1 Tax=Aliarcobacter butzleri TaxID=28197 RepID=UPI0021B5D8D7|nr:helix-turn-helix domain-containing protein [Aliarcobacter butzleri]MCT7642634.1 helix-turn-helix domain-containing protein [Aliarcobacter butzleri]
MKNLNNIKKKTKFTQISNVCLHDKRLNLDVRGLMSILMSYPNDWQFYNQNISKIANIGVDKLNKLYKQLEMYGYLKRIKRRDKKGKFRGYEFKLCDVGNIKMDNSLESRKVEKPLRQKSVTDKSAVTNTNTKYDFGDDDYQDKMYELNQKLLQKQLNKDIQIQKLENLSVSTQNQIDF